MVWKHNAQHIADLIQYLGLHQYLGSNSISQNLGTKLRSKLTGFEIEVGLTGTDTKRFNW